MVQKFCSKYKNTNNGWIISPYFSMMTSWHTSWHLPMFSCKAISIWLALEDVFVLSENNKSQLHATAFYEPSCPFNNSRQSNMTITTFYTLHRIRNNQHRKQYLNYQECCNEIFLVVLRCYCDWSTYKVSFTGLLT